MPGGKQVEFGKVWEVHFEFFLTAAHGQPSLAVLVGGHSHRGAPEDRHSCGE